VPELIGKRFHVRMHRRGFNGKLSSQQEAQFLDGFLFASHLRERRVANG
jgi:hypothetical protein